MAPGLAAVRPKTRVWGSSLSGQPSRPAPGPFSAPIRIGPRLCLRRTRVWSPHPDKLGSTRALSNDAGQVVGNYDYDAYGNTSQSGVLQPFQFAGQYTDAESGLQYLRARYYDATTQQFLSRDPLVLLTRRPYVYVDDTPIDRKDPTGLFSFGFQGDANAFLGLSWGGAWNWGKGLAYWSGERDRNNIGNYDVAGWFLGGTKNYEAFGPRNPDTGGLNGENGVIGAGAGVSGGLWISNASTRADFGGVFHTCSVNTPWLNVSFAWASAGPNRYDTNWVLDVSRGPSVGGGVVTIDTNTTYPSNSYFYGG